jgi:hypothetical protein
VAALSSLLMISHFGGKSSRGGFLGRKPNCLLVMNIGKSSCSDLGISSNNRKLVLYALVEMLAILMKLPDWFFTDFINYCA